MTKVNLTIDEGTFILVREILRAERGEDVTTEQVVEAIKAVINYLKGLEDDD